MNGIDDVNKSLLGLYCNDPRFLVELHEVQQYYDFYEGRPFNGQEEDYNNDKGQLWKVKARDYKPTREVRNLVKKLMKKQGRFMTSVPPTLVLSAVQGELDRERIDAKRGLIDDILKDGKFWNKFSKAFMDCTIGKRVLLALIVEQDESGNPVDDKPLRFRFYTMPEFTYEYDPNDVDKLVKVQIAYQDEETVGKIQQEQRWHKWTYEMREDNYCWCVYEVVDGTNTTAFIEVMASPLVSSEHLEDDVHSQQVELRQEWNTGLSMIPCKVILNDGLTGDVRGHSDVKDLMDMAMDYNKTISDYRDALRFKMFEQPVFIDADSNSLAELKIAPNAVIDLKSDPSLGNGVNASSVAKAQMLSSTFNFQPAADAYLTRLKQDMYELMEQPMPEQLVDVPSGKALKMIYYDLITRCEEKWSEWDEALTWLVQLIEEAILVYGLYGDKADIDCMNLETTISWSHNYPIPDDEADNKTVAIAEVQASVRSKKSYIEEFSNNEDAEAEYQQILDETNQMNEINNAMLGLDNTKGPTDDESKNKQNE